MSAWRQPITGIRRLTQHGDLGVPDAWPSSQGNIATIAIHRDGDVLTEEIAAMIVHALVGNLIRGLSISGI